MRCSAGVFLVKADSQSPLGVALVNTAASAPVRRSTSALRWFVPTPVAMLLDPSLSNDAKVLAGILLHYDGPRGCIPKIGSLMRDLNTSKHTVFRLLEELERYGFLRRNRRGRRNEYNLFPVYEKPVRPDDMLATGQLSIQNSTRRKPVPRRILRKARPIPELPVEIEAKSVSPVRSIDTAPSVADCKTVTPPSARVDHIAPAAQERVAPVRPDYSILSSKDVASMRPIATPTSLQPVSPVRSQNVASVRPLTTNKSHPCDLQEKKNHEFIKNQQQQYPAAAVEISSEAIGAIALALVPLGINSDDAIAWAQELIDLPLDDVTTAAKLLLAKPAYRRGEVRTPAKYLRTLCMTTVAADRRLREHEVLKRGGASEPESQAMDIFATLAEDDRVHVIERARVFAEPNAALWPMAVAIALRGLNLYSFPPPQ